MDEFRKPYEYEEEKGVTGILLIFFAMLLACETFISVAAGIIGYNDVKAMSLPANAFLVLALAFVIFPLFNAFVLRKTKKFAVRVTKVYLAARLVYYIPFTIMNTIFMVKDIHIEKTFPDYWKEYNGIMVGTAISLFYLLAFSITWYLYFIRSKKVKEFYFGKNEASA